MFTRIRISFRNHSVLVLETSLPTVKESYQDIIAHFVMTVGVNEKKIETSCEGPNHNLIDEQIHQNLSLWIANYRTKMQLYSM
jgi:hypothetical protein